MVPLIMWMELEYVNWKYPRRNKMKMPASVVGPAFLFIGINVSKRAFQPCQYALSILQVYGNGILLYQL